MNYFKDGNTNEVYAYDQEQIDGGWVKEGLVKMSQKEIDAHLNPVQTTEQLSEAARFKRDALLKKSDWTQVGDAPVDKEAWASYRQALRDVPEQAGFPQVIDWPVAPV